MGRLMQPSGIRRVRQFEISGPKFQRPNNTTAYSVYDALLPDGTYNALEIPGVTATGNRLVTITNQRVSQSNAAGLNISYLLLVFGSNFTGGGNVDNSLVNVPYDVTSFFRGSVLSVTSGAKQGGVALTVDTTAVFRTDANGSLWYLLAANTAITPVANTEYFVTLSGYEYAED